MLAVIQKASDNESGSNHETGEFLSYLDLFNCLCLAVGQRLIWLDLFLVSFTVFRHFADVILLIVAAITPMLRV